MKILKLVDERLSDYRLPTLMIVAVSCDWKCAKDAHFPEALCQNHQWKDVEPIDATPQEIYEAFVRNPITQGLLFGGLEPFRQFEEMLDVIRYFRSQNSTAPIVIYTGYREDEIKDEVLILSGFPNIIVKFGRYVPRQAAHLDPVLGVKLASDNQYAKLISKEYMK